MTVFAVAKPGFFSFYYVQLDSTACHGQCILFASEKWCHFPNCHVSSSLLHSRRPQVSDYLCDVVIYKTNTILSHLNHVSFYPPSTLLPMIRSLSGPERKSLIFYLQCCQLWCHGVCYWPWDHTRFGFSRYNFVCLFRLPLVFFLPTSHYLSLLKKGKAYLFIHMNKQY